MKHINTYSNFKLYENNRSNFTSMFRYNGYMIDRKDEKRVREMFNGLLTKIYSEDSDLLNDIVDDMTNGDDFWWVGDGEYFKDFSFDEEQKVWNIVYCEEQFDEESDYITDIEKTESSMNFSISNICDFLDFIMKNKRVSYILNHKAMKKINEGFTKNFISKKDGGKLIREMFSGLLTKLYTQNKDLFNDISNKIEMGGDGGDGTDEEYWFISSDQYFKEFKFDPNEKTWSIEYTYNVFEKKEGQSDEEGEWVDHYGTIDIDKFDIDEICLLFDYMMSDHRILEFVNKKAILNINESKFTDRFKSDKEIRMVFNALLDKLYNDDYGYEIFKKIELELSGTGGLDVPLQIENGEFGGLNKMFGENFWYIDYTESVGGNEYTYETISSETCSINYLIDIINIIMEEPGVIGFINSDVMKKINR